MIGNELNDILRAQADNDFEAVKILLKKNPLLCTAKNSNGLTPVHMAAQLGQMDFLHYFFKCYFDVNQLQDCHNQTPLHRAARFKQEKVVEFLLSKGANADALDVHNYKPSSCCFGNQVIINLLKANEKEHSLFTLSSLAVDTRPYLKEELGDVVYQCQQEAVLHYNAIQKQRAENKSVMDEGIRNLQRDFIILGL